MKPIRIFRHISCEGPGYLGEVLDRHETPYEVVAIDQGAVVPCSLDDVSALVFMGGPMSVNDPRAWINQELELIRSAVARDMPVLGHCLGGQLISKALGGTVGPNSVKEIGWYPVERLDNAVADDWLGPLPRRFTVFHWHGEIFSLPDGAKLILRSNHCSHQGFVVGNTLALQCHVEMTGPMVQEWAVLYADEIALPTETVQGPNHMTEGLPERVAALQAVADRLYERWLRPILS